MPLHFTSPLGRPGGAFLEGLQGRLSVTPASNIILSR